MDIIVTTPKSQMAAAAQEAADCLRDGGGEYFRRFAHGQAPTVSPGDRVYYVEDGFIRGFAVVDHTDDLKAEGKTCDSTGRAWANGFYVCMRADTWVWIRPIPMTGFQGFRYAAYAGENGIQIHINGVTHRVLAEGGWCDPRPRSCRVCGCTDRYGCAESDVASQPHIVSRMCHWVEEDLCSACAKKSLNRRGRGAELTGLF